MKTNALDISTTSMFSEILLDQSLLTLIIDDKER
jgi:hypothetical protein